MAHYIDINSDLGESFGNYTIGRDEEVIAEVNSVNIACGWHGGDPLVMDNTLELAKRYGAAVGAHPGFPDLLGFGRRNMAVSPAEMYAYVLYQLGAFHGFAKKHGLQIQHVKPHGAMYNMAAQDLAMAEAICKAIRDFDSQMILMALAGSCMVEAGKTIGLRVAQEAFADRAYEEDGSLVSRAKPGAMIRDPKIAAKRVVDMIHTGQLISITGKPISIVCDTVCVHGDSPEAVNFSRGITSALKEQGVQCTNLSTFLS